MDKVSRRSFFVTSATVAAGAAATAVPGVAAAGVEGDPAAVRVEPNSPPAREPVTAYVRDREAGQVTVMSGTSEATYRDPALVRRLLYAAAESGEGE